jgi:hypothetical protein
LSNKLKSFILANKTIEQIRDDFRLKFPVFASLADATLDMYIELSFCDVPAGFINCGFDCAYQAFLYGIAHNLTYFNALGGNASIPQNSRIVSSKSADGLTISYEAINTPANTPANIYNYFSTTPFGRLLLSLLDTCGLTSSCGGFIA